MKVLITNSVPLNGGDEALLRALLGTLGGHLPEAQFTVLTSSTQLARTVLPDLTFDDDLEYAIPEFARNALATVSGSGGSPARRIAASTARKGLRLVSGHRGRQRVLERYHEADAIFLAPGGYLHDHYPVADRLHALELAVETGKPVLLVGHSLGPFWKRASMLRAREVLNSVTRIVVRERYSLGHLRACGVREDHVSMAADLAFAWADLAPDLFCERAPSARRLGLCFRRWPLRDAGNARQTRAKAAALSKWLLRDPSVELVFTSTCQGIYGYVDDSRLAEEIVADLPASLQPRCSVDRAHRSPREMIQFLGSLDACISMRMHVCVLAMLGGTPAMALDYEKKSVGLYEMMRFDRYHIDFRLDYQRWQLATESFLSDLGRICPTLRERVSEMARSASHAIADAARAANLVR